jgi:hypothetical protein
LPNVANAPVKQVREGGETSTSGHQKDRERVWLCRFLARAIKGLDPKPPLREIAESGVNAQASAA